MPNFKDLTGGKFGRWTVLERCGHKGKSIAWKVICECGKESLLTGGSLTSGNSKSCGCLNDERIKKLNFKHGERNRLYSIWKNMRKRCNNPNNPAFNNYGGRGIEVCEEWNDYLKFKKWAISNGYNSDLTLDRIDNDKGYSPYNCRWATRKEQNRNKRNSRLITHNGVTRTCAEWSEITGIPYQTLQGRIHEHENIDIFKK